jgi:hypothetical protein
MGEFNAELVLSGKTYKIGGTITTQDIEPVEPPVVEPPVVEPNPPTQPPIVPPFNPPDNDLAKYLLEPTNPPAVASLK